MRMTRRWHPSARVSRHASGALRLLGLTLLVMLSAIVTKHNVRSGLVPLAELSVGAGTQRDAGAAGALVIVDPLLGSADLSEPPLPASPGAEAALEDAPVGASAEPAAGARVPSRALAGAVRWFNGRPVRPVRTIWMTVTAYSPDARSCGPSADGITASLHSVWANAHRLVAADSRVLPLGSMVSVPGYDSGRVVPVLDRGGKIKGHRLDVLFPTHAEARRWGVRRVPVTVWGYADGAPPTDWRAVRDSARRR